MHKKPLTILGINPGTRYLGMAVFQGSDLRDWRVKSIDGKWSKEKMEKTIKILSGCIEWYKPDALAMKRLSLYRSSSNLNKLVTKIKNLCGRKRLRVYQYSIKDLEALFSEEEKIKNKRKLAEIVVSRYPVLFYELNKEKSRRNPYYIRMFEAVALASACFHQLDRKLNLLKHVQE